MNQLYESALGLYDLKLALLVAKKSQKDPREYLPYLQDLQKMDLRRRCYCIDNDLRRYDKALVHLLQLDCFEEVTSYVQKHELYEKALSQCSYDKDKTDQLMFLYANFLRQNNRYREAGMGMYES